MTAAASVGRRDPPAPDARQAGRPLTARRGGAADVGSALHRRERICRPPRSGTFRPHGKRHPGGRRRRGGGFGRDGRPQRRRARGRGPAAEDPGPRRPRLDPSPGRRDRRQRLRQRRPLGPVGSPGDARRRRRTRAACPSSRRRRTWSSTAWVAAGRCSRGPPGRSCAGSGRDADVVFEVINGITFLTPLWLRKPRVALVNHPHRALYVGEFGRRLGRLLSAALEELPLRLLYRRVPFLTISDSAREELVAIDGIPAEQHHHRLLRRRTRPVRPGRARPRAAPALRRAPEGLQAHRGAARHAHRAARGHARHRRPGRPRRDARRRDLAARAWRAGPRARLRRRADQGRSLPPGLGARDRLGLRGLVADRDGGRAVRHPERGAGGRRSARVDRRRRDRSAGRRPCRPATPRQGGCSKTASCASGSARRRRRRAETFTWERTASDHARRRAAPAVAGARSPVGRGRERCRSGQRRAARPSPRC